MGKRQVFRRRWSYDAGPVAPVSAWIAIGTSRPPAEAFAAFHDATRRPRHRSSWGIATLFLLERGCGAMFDQQNLLEDNRKLVEKFGATDVSDLDDELVPDFYTFQKGLIYSCRNFDTFIEAVEDDDKDCAIVSGFNPSGTMHLGHRAVFDTNLYFQREYDLPIFVPLSDDETYVSDKIDDQDQAFRNAWELSKELLAYGYDPENTHIIIDRYYTSIYNLAINYSKRLTTSEIKAAYGYENEDNPGLYFYPAVQSSHILLPIERFDKDRVLVPIGPDEDAHLRISRDVADRVGVNKPAAIHTTFVPGLDGKKMSASKENFIGLNEGKESIQEKINQAYTGGHVSKEEHRELGGDPEKDVPLFYLDKYFLDDEEAEQMRQKYSEGELLSGEVKERLFEEVWEFVSDFQQRREEITDDDVRSVLLENEKGDDLIDRLITPAPERK
jgi:tryptophanyl-tRNA synthetase